jgi:hypothetical protein
VFSLGELSPIGEIRTDEQTVKGPLNPSSEKVDEVGFDPDDLDAILCEGPDCL